MTNPIEELKEKIATMQHNLKVLEQLEAEKTDVEKAYRDAYGYFPETNGFAMSDGDVISWDAFQKGWDAAQKPKAVPVEEPQSKPIVIDEVVDRIVKKYQAQKLWNRVRNELGYSIDCCDEIVDLVEKWLPEPQSAEGSQNVDTELLVEGFNHCLDKIKVMLR